MNTEQTQFGSGWGRTIGVVAVGVGATNVVVMIWILLMEASGHVGGDLTTRLSWFIFDYGFTLDMLACLLALLAIWSGKPGRRFGLAALMLVAVSFGLLFIG